MHVEDTLNCLQSKSVDEILDGFSADTRWNGYLDSSFTSSRNKNQIKSFFQTMKNLEMKICLTVTNC